MAKLTIEVSAEELEKAIQGAYLKQKSKKSTCRASAKERAPRAIVGKCIA